MKQVPQKDAPLKLNETGTWIRDDVSYEVNEPDAYALEEALRQKEKHTGEVVVITSGPARAQQVLREALAKGADRAIHLEDDKFVGLDAFNTAKAFAAAIKDEKFDLIFTGLQSDDYGYAQTGVILAELLGWPHATIIMQIEKTDSGIRVKRELEAGYFQFVDMPTPAVLTIQSGINKLRYATLIGIKQAKNKPMRKVALAEVQSAIGRICRRSSACTFRRKRKRRKSSKVRPRKWRRSWWTRCATNCACCRDGGVEVRTMRQIDSPPPNLGQNRGIWHGPSSKVWIPRNTSGRVGIFIFGAAFVAFGLGLIASSFMLKAELQGMIQSRLIGFFVSFLAVMMVLCVGCWLLWYGSRLLRSSFRHPTIRR